VGWAEAIASGGNALVFTPKGWDNIAWGNELVVLHKSTTCFAARCCGITLGRLMSLLASQKTLVSQGLAKRHFGLSRDV
jgi:hypothetical protein